MNQQFYSNIDLLGNYFANLRVDGLSTSDINDLSNVMGLITYDIDLNEFKGMSGNQMKKFNQDNSFENVVIVRKLAGNVELLADSTQSTLILEEGDNIRMTVNEGTKTITLNANVNYTADNYSQVFGDLSNVEYLIEHNLGSSNVVVSVLWEDESNVNSNLNVLRYINIDEDTVKVVLNEPPTTENVLKATINSKHGVRGFQGIAGPTGPQGEVGSQGNQGVPGYVGFEYESSDVNKTLRISNIGEVELTSVLQVYDNGLVEYLEFNGLNNETGVLINGSNVANVLTLNYQHSNVTTIESLSDISFLNINFKNTSNSTVIEMFNIAGDGRISTNYLEQSSNTLLMGSMDGGIDVFVDEHIPNRAVMRRSRRVITAAELKNSFSQPATLVTPDGGKTIVPHQIIGRMIYGSTPFDFGVRQVTIEVQGCNDPIVLLDNELLDYDIVSLPGFEGVFHYSVNKTNTPSNMFTRSSLPLQLKTYTSNPSVGDGQLEIIVHYTLI